mgnify:CR=1 FL=1
MSGFVRWFAICEKTQQLKILINNVNLREFILVKKI